MKNSIHLKVVREQFDGFGSSFVDSPSSRVVRKKESRQRALWIWPQPPRRSQNNPLGITDLWTLSRVADTPPFSFQRGRDLPKTRLGAGEASSVQVLASAPICSAKASRSLRGATFLHKSVTREKLTSWRGCLGLLALLWAILSMPPRIASADSHLQITGDSLSSFGEYYILRERLWYSCLLDGQGEYRTGRIFDSRGRIGRRAIGNFLMYSSELSLQQRIRLLVRRKSSLEMQLRLAQRQPRLTNGKSKADLMAEIRDVKRKMSLLRRELRLCQTSLEELK